MRISDWSSDVCSSDLPARKPVDDARAARAAVAGRDLLWNPVPPPIPLSRSGNGVLAEQHLLQRTSDAPRAYGADAHQVDALCRHGDRAGALVELLYPQHAVAGAAARALRAVL